MPRSLYIPRQVLASIENHVQTATDRAVHGFLSAHEDEDTLTGELGSCLRSRVQTINVENDEINGPWKWSLTYSKFRGRGPAAPESFIGADGIFELTLDYGTQTDSKSLLFQSKTEWKTDATLLNQAGRLSTWREAAIFINYTSQDFYAYSIDSVLASRGKELDAKNKLTLKEAFTKYFLNCRIGSMDIRYDSSHRRLIWRDLRGAVVATQFSIPNRFRLQIRSPNANKKVDFEKLVPLNEIHDHRLQAAPDEMLMPLLSENMESAKRRKRLLSMTYHPDRYSEQDELLRDLMKRRMQEINAAYDGIERSRGDDDGQSG
jgi:hypothetical protein